MYKKFLILFILPCGILFSMPDPKQIMEKSFEIDSNYKDFISENQMIIQDEKGNKDEKKLLLKKWRKKDNIKLLIRIEYPEDLKGMKFLLWSSKNKEDDKWIFLPASNLVRRINSSEKNKSFLGSDFNYKDLEVKELNSFKFSLISEEKYENRDVFKILGVLNQPDVYSKIIFYVDKSNYLPLKLELFDLDGNLIKENYTLSFKKIQGHWVITKSKLLSKKTNSFTTMYVHNITFNNNLKENEFSKSILKK